MRLNMMARARDFLSARRRTVAPGARSEAATRVKPAPLPTAATVDSLPAFIQAWMKDAPPQWVAVEGDNLDALRQRADWPVLTARRKALRFYQAGSLVHLEGEGREEYAVDAGGALYPLDDAAQIIRANAAAGLLLTSHRKVTEYVRFYCNECPRTNDADGPFRLDELWTLVSREHRFDKQVLIRRFEDHSGFFMLQACILKDSAQLHVLFLLHANGRMGLFAKKDFGLPYAKDDVSVIQATTDQSPERIDYRALLNALDAANSQPESKKGLGVMEEYLFPR